MLPGKIPLFVTMDLEIAFDHCLVEQRQILVELQKDLAALECPVTIFTVANAASLFDQEVKSLQRSGHEIACHGNTHIKSENYRTMREPDISSNLSQARRTLTGITGIRPISFRGPAMTTSAVSQKVLSREGFAVDFSVCSQRMDLINSQGGTFGWLFAPRSVYRPHARTPFRRGKQPLFVVPMRCYGIPFASGPLYLIGLAGMKAYFRLLYRGAIRSLAPIVYLFHSYEFCRQTGKRQQKLLHRLYRQDRRWRYQQNLDLLRYMLSLPDIMPVTGRQYITHIKEQQGNRSYV